MSKRLIMGWIFICFFMEGKAQLSMTDVVQRYNSYQAVWYKTKLQLVLNQDKYSPGDTAFFKAYFLTENLMRVPGKQIVHVNLVDHLGHSAVQIRFHVNHGLGINQVVIPDDLAPGVYYITAHNTWMKNFDPSGIFKKKISIVKKNQVVEVEQPFLRAAAEGGHLITGVPNKISVYTHRKGLAIQLIDSAGQEIDKKITDDSGTGSFKLIPAPHAHYSARIAGDTMQVALPVAQLEGVSLQVEPGLNNEVVSIRLATAVNSAYQGKNLMLVITARGNIHFSTMLEHKTTDSVQVKTSELPYGLAHLSVLDPSGVVVASRDFYNYRNPMVVNLQPGQTNYQPREKVKLDITIADQAGKPIEGEFSIRAVNASLFEVEPADAFRDDLAVLSGLKMPYQIDRSQQQWLTSLDNVLIANTEPMPWTTILSKSPSTPSHLFTNVIEKRGKAYFANTDTPLPDLTQISFYLQHNAKFVQTFTTDHGSVGFTIPAFYGDDEFFYMAQLLNQDEVTNIRIAWEEDAFPLPKPPLGREHENIDAYAQFNQRKRLIDQSFGVHQQLKEAIPNASKESKDVWEADVSINVEDYVLFPTLQEFIKEVVPAMYYRKTKKGDVVRVHILSPLPAMTSPLYIIDGIATRNTTFFLSLKPSEIKTMKIINSRERLQASGLLGKYGIVVVETKNGSFREPLDADSKRFTGLNIPLQFNSYNRPATHSFIPDFRSTIYWNPSVKTDANGKASIEFYSSDDVGKFNIRMEGITVGAEPFSAEQPIRVSVGVEKH